MGANSALRRAIKTLSRPFLNDTTYSYVQAIAKSKDIKDGTWSEPELDLLSLAVRADEVALDIGANFGIYSYFLDKLLTNGKVYAFEPIPFTFATLKKVAGRLNFRNVELISKGCSDKTETVTFSVPVQESGALGSGQAYLGDRNDAHGDAETIKTQVRWDKTTTFECEVVALDDFLPSLTNLSLIKCDIEGAELHAFRGAQQLIAINLPTVICEINPWFLQGFGLQLEDLIDFFFEQEYQLYAYRETPSGRRLQEVMVADVSEDNYIFIHPKYLSRFSSLLN